MGKLLSLVLGVGIGGCALAMALLAMMFRMDSLDGRSRCQTTNEGHGVPPTVRFFAEGKRGECIYLDSRSKQGSEIEVRWEDANYTNLLAIEEELRTNNVLATGVFAQPITMA